MSPSISLGEYQKLVDFCATHRLNQPISNGSALHARILIEKLFEIAKGHVQLVSGSLTEVTSAGVDVYSYSPVIERAKSFLSTPGATLSIIVQSGSISSGDENKFLSELRNDPARMGSIDVIVPKPKLLGQSAPHFMVADGAAYRLETGSDALPQSESTAAVANFGDIKSASALVGLFNGLLSFLSVGDNTTSRVTYPPSTLTV